MLLYCMSERMLFVNVIPITSSFLLMREHVRLFQISNDPLDSTLRNSHHFGYIPKP